MDSSLDSSESLHRITSLVTAVICSAVAILFLTVHLVTFIITEYERTIMGKSFATYCFSMLLSCFTLFGLGQRTPIHFFEGPAIIYHFLSLAQSTWLLSTSIETWKSIKSSKSQQNYELKNSWRYFFYSLYSWLLPALITGVTLLVDEDTDRPDSWVPTCSWSCTFSQTSGFFFLYFVPVTVNLILNFLFIEATVKKLIGRSTVYQRESMVKEFPYYIRLNLLIGFTWLVGFISEYTRSDSIAVIYVLLNAIQGLYIFLIMTFHGKISTFIYYVDTESDLKMLTQDDDECEQYEVTGVSSSTII